MKTKILQSERPRTLAVIFETGDETMSGLLKMVKEHQLRADQLTAIRAFSDAVLGFFEWETKKYRHIPVNEQVEVLSLVGDIAIDGDEPKIHAHVVLGRDDGTTLGGHLIQAHVRPTLEVIVDESPEHLRRAYDPESRLDLIAL